MSSSDQQERLGELIDGYRSTALLYVAAKLGIADLLSSGPANANELAARLRVNADALGRYLRALAAIGILRTGDDGNFALTSLGSALRLGAPGSAKDRAILAGDEFFPTWGALLNAVQTGEPQFQRIFGLSAWEHREANPELSASFNSWLHEETAQAADSILRAYDFRKRARNCGRGRRSWRSPLDPSVGASASARRPHRLAACCRRGPLHS